ncbi:MurR/RpiR family transcriptional regulator [Nocardioides panacihumi]|uniref:MurR/RpiR family transcriptional regulator n=1 Tax=Nocardioides panacihumi TaxID=400774 RepID=A0ABN2QSG0_9ACTN
MTVAERLREGLGRCSPAERRVGRALLADYPVAGLETVASLAARAETSGPTVLRFLARLGFAGFPEFQHTLRAELAEREASPLAMLSSADVTAGSDTGGRPRVDVLARALATVPTATVQTLEQLPGDELSAAIELMADRRRRILAEGGRFTRLIAEYLVRHLVQVRGGAHVLPLHPVERADLLVGLGRRDVLVVFDFRRYEAASKELADRCAEAGAKVILVTDRWLSPIASVADVVLPVRVEPLSIYDSLVPAFAVAEVLVAGVLEACGERAVERLRQFEEVSQRYGVL